jgi:hypothetical protein
VLKVVAKVAFEISDCLQQSPWNGSEIWNEKSGKIFVQLEQNSIPELKKLGYFKKLQLNPVLAPGRH